MPPTALSPSEEFLKRAIPMSEIGPQDKAKSLLSPGRFWTYQQLTPPKLSSLKCFKVTH